MIEYNLNNFAVYEIEAPSSTNKAVFFSHANGIPALTYKSLLEKMAKELNAHVITYDLRGFGKTTKQSLENNASKVWFWDILAQDHEELFFAMQKKLPQIKEWILCGHSLGAWLSILSMRKLNVAKLILMDPPILPSKIIFPWFILHLLKKTELSPLSKKVKKRKKMFPSFEIAKQELKKSRLMQNWPLESVENYINGSFHVNDQNSIIHLRHDPNWEGKIFEEYPMGAWRGFITIPKKIRNNIQPFFLVGENSDTCNLNAKYWVKLFFPKLKWIKIKNGTHMFPIEQQAETLKELKEIINS